MGYFSIIAFIGLTLGWMYIIFNSFRKNLKFSLQIIRFLICIVFISLGYVVFFLWDKVFGLFSYASPLLYTYVDSIYIKNLEKSRPAIPGNGSPLNNSDHPSKEVIAVMRSNTPFAKAMHQSLEKAFQSSGIRLEFMDIDEDENIDRQASVLNKALKRRPDAIILMPISSNGPIIEPVIKAIKDYDIPVITIDRKLRKEEFINRKVKPPLHVKSNFHLGGQIAAEILAKHVGKVGKFFVISGPEKSEEANERKRAFMEEIINRLPGSGIYCEYTKKWSENEATAIMRNILRRHTIIDGVFGANDTLALGALRAIEEQGRDVPIVGYDGIDQIIKEIRRGKILATVDVDITSQANRVFQKIEELIIYQEKPKTILDSEEILITPKPLERTRLVE